MKVAVILPAAGLGTRMGKSSAEKTGTSRKQFMLLDGSPILIHTVRKFAASDRVSEIVVAVRAEDVEWVSEMLAQEFPDGARSVRARVRVVEGGNSRQESVENALATVNPETDLVAVHDAVRPFIDLETIHKVFDEAAETGAAIVGVPAVDTVKQVSRGNRACQDPRDAASREAGDGADAAGLPLRPAGAGVPVGAGGRLHRHGRIEPGGTAGCGSERCAGQRPEYQDHEAGRYGSGTPVPAGRNRERSPI